MAGDRLVSGDAGRDGAAGVGGARGLGAFGFGGLIGEVSLRSVVDSMSEGFTLLDGDFRIVEVNAEALRLDGRSRDALIGKTHWEAYPGSEQHVLGRLYRRAMLERCSVALEHRYVWEDGHSAWLDMRGYPIEGGGLALFFRDVTARREGERRLGESEARFRAAVGAVHGILWTNDAEGRMAGDQPGWSELTGQGFDEYQGYGWAAAVHPDDAGPTVVAWEAAVSARVPFIFEHRVRRHDGVWRRFAVRAIPVLDDAGHIREWVGVHSDITEATEAQLQSARNTETFAALVRNSPFGIYVVDAGFRFFELSEGAAKVFGGVEGLIGRDFAEVLRLTWTEPFASEAISRFRTTLETGEPYFSASTVEHRADSDAVEAYDWRIERIGLPDGTNGVVCYFYDLSERMKLEGELRQALGDKELLAQEIEHRVQNSLMIVSSLLALQRSSARSPETADALAAASSRVLAIGRVHQRLYKGQDIQAIEFGDYLQQLCRDIQETFSRTNISFDIQTDAVQLPVDQAVRLGIVANELITNACKYCGTGSDATVFVRLEVRAQALVLTVRDTGPGVPDDFAPEGGKGLGLRAIRALVRQFGGTFVFPRAGDPARFEITAPVGVVKV